MHTLSEKACPAELRLVDRADEYAILHFWNLVLVVWQHWPEPRVCRWLGDFGRELAQNLSVEKVSSVSILIPRGHPPSLEVREALAFLHRDTFSITHRSALVLSRQGFIAAGIRGNILKLLPQFVRRTPQTVFHRLDRAIEWATDGLVLPENANISVPELVQGMRVYASRVHVGPLCGAIAG